MKLTTLAVLAGLSRVFFAQESETTEQVPILSLSEIVLEQYPVQHADPDDLLEIASSLVGRYYFVQEHGGRASNPVTNLRQLGRTVIVYDTPEETKRALAILGRLDVAPSTGAQAMRTVEYAPRFVSLKTVTESLKPFDHVGFQLSDVDERGLVVIRGRSDEVTAMLELLARVDVPEKQVLVTCTLVGSSSAPDALPLPKDLAENLAKLLPEHQFSQLGMALLQTSVGSERPFSLGIESGRRLPNGFVTTGSTYQFTFQPVAYDEKTGSLTVERCQLREALGGSAGSADAPPERMREIFTTNTTFRGGEYTVLAATGADPFLLLAVRVTPIGG